MKVRLVCVSAKEKLMAYCRIICLEMTISHLPVLFMLDLRSGTSRFHRSCTLCKRPHSDSVNIKSKMNYSPVRLCKWKPQVTFILAHHG